MAQETTKSGQINNFILNKLLPSLSRGRVATESSSRQLWKDSYDMDKGFFDHIISNQDLILKDPVYRKAINDIIQDHNWKTKQGQEVLSKFLSGYLTSAQTNWQNLDEAQILLERNPEYNFVSWQKKNYPVVAGSPIGMGAKADGQGFSFSETINKRVAFFEDIIKKGEVLNHPAAKLAAMQLPNWKAAWGFLQSGGDLTYLETLGSQSKEGARALKEAIKAQSQTFIEKALTGERGMSPEDESKNQMLKDLYETVQTMYASTSRDFYRSFKTESKTTEGFNTMFMDTFGEDSNIDEAVTSGNGEIKTGDISYYPINVSDKRLEDFVTKLAAEGVNTDLLVRFNQLKKLNSEIFRITDGQLTLWDKYKKDDAMWDKEDYLEKVNTILSARLYGTDSLGVMNSQFESYKNGLNIALTDGDLLYSGRVLTEESLENISEDPDESDDVEQELKNKLKEEWPKTSDYLESSIDAEQELVEYNPNDYMYGIPIPGAEKPKDVDIKETETPVESIEDIRRRLLENIPKPEIKKEIKTEAKISERLPFHAQRKGSPLYLDTDDIPIETIDKINSNFSFTKGASGWSSSNVDAWFDRNNLDHYYLSTLKNAVDKNTLFNIGGDAIPMILQNRLSLFAAKNIMSAQSSVDLIKQEFYKNNADRSIDEFYSWLSEYSGSNKHTKEEFSRLIVLAVKGMNETKPYGLIQETKRMPGYQTKGTLGRSLYEDVISKFGMSPKELTNKTVYRTLGDGSVESFKIGRVLRDRDTGEWKFFPKQKKMKVNGKIVTTPNQVYKLDDFTFKKTEVPETNTTQEFEDVSTQNPEDYQEEFNVIENEFNISKGLLSAIMETETGGADSDSLKESFNKEQAQGSFQQRPIFIKEIKRITKGTPYEKEMANYDPNDPIQAAKATAIYINYLKTNRNMSENRAIRAYNAGKFGSTGRAAGVSVKYLRKVKTSQQRYKQ